MIGGYTVSMLENLLIGMTPEKAGELIRQVLAFAVQVIGEMGGIRVVEALLIAGFILGLLACMYEIKAIGKTTKR